jgi:trigger factor
VSNEAELKNQNIVVAITKNPGLQVALDITVMPHAVEAAYNKALKAINKEVSIPGFRKGKAPDHIIVQNYEKQIQGEWRETLLNDSFQEAMALGNIRPFKNNAIRMSGLKQLLLGQPAQFKIEFESSPEVPFINLEEIVLKAPEIETINEEEVDKVVENLRFYYAEWTDVADRAVQEKDHVELDIDKLDEPFEKLADNMRFPVEEGQMATWIRKLIIGLKTGESVEGTSEQEENQPQNPNFVPTRCKITVNAIKKPILPEINDAFAVRMGVSTMAELREKIMSDLNTRAEQESHEALRKQLDTFLLEHYNFEIPASVLKDEQEQRMANAMEWLAKNQAPADVVEQRKQELEQRLPQEVESSYRLFFLLLTFAQRVGIELTKEEVAAELNYQMQSRGITLNPQQIKEVESKIAQQLFLRHSRDYIIENIMSKK